MHFPKSITWKNGALNVKLCQHNLTVTFKLTMFLNTAKYLTKINLYVYMHMSKKGANCLRDNSMRALI